MSHYKLNNNSNVWQLTMSHINCSDIFEVENRRQPAMSTDTWYMNTGDERASENRERGIYINFIWKCIIKMSVYTFTYCIFVFIYFSSITNQPVNFTIRNTRNKQCHKCMFYFLIFAFCIIYIYELIYLWADRVIFNSLKWCLKLFGSSDIIIGWRIETKLRKIPNLILDMQFNPFGWFLRFNFIRTRCVTYSNLDFNFLFFHACSWVLVSNPSSAFSIQP